ncbi:hypothetical protein [Actinoallomurus sp. NPDC050550]|uniref:hypothetical protein n=1 Tax=Actinoallomurus sp. NPDC050550 TaxID=3154937 RepID=UPI0033DFD5C5
MDTDQLVKAVHQLAWVDTGELRCAEAGHAAGHVCLAVSAGASLSVLLEELRKWYGRPRTLVMDGHRDPAVTGRSGLPLLEPFGERLVEIHAWACRGRWIGCGTTRTDDDLRLILLLAERAEPAMDGLPEGVSWADRVVAVTGSDTDLTNPVDWAAVEHRMGTALPGDYKRLAELFGSGAFDAYLRFYVPNAGISSFDIVRHTEQLAQWVKENDSRQWKPYEVFPTPGGLLEWASSEQGHSFYWLTEGPDPDKWPILATEDDYRVWERFEGSTAEFIYRMLTDPNHPFSTARYFDIHWFFGY